MLNQEALAGKGLKALNVLLPKFKTFNLIQKLCASYLMFLSVQCFPMQVKYGDSPSPKDVNGSIL